MKSFTRTRVVKSNAVEVSAPCLVECPTEEFQFLSNHLSVVRDLNDSLPEGEKFSGLEGEEKWHPPTITAKDEEEVNTLLQEAEAKAREILAEAEKMRTQAERELQQAQEEAASLLEKARREAEEQSSRLREEVSQQAYQEGHDLGLSQGWQEGKAQGLKEAECIKEEAQNILRLAQRAAQEEWEKVDEVLLQLALKIAERIVRAHILEHPEQLLQRIRALSLLPEEREGWKLHVSSQDFQWLSQSSLGDLNIPLLEDQTLNPGDCFLECTEGIFDARVKVQLERCEQLLREELRHDQLA